MGGGVLVAAHIDFGFYSGVGYREMIIIASKSDWRGLHAQTGSIILRAILAIAGIAALAQDMVGEAALVDA